MQYDIFISYRREGGKSYARTIKPELEKRGFRVFLDFDELDDGVFDKRIMDAINEAPVFLLILSRGALDRCINEGDWVREEILHAEKTRRHIIPVEVDKTFRSIPQNIPEEIRQVLGAHQFSQIDTETLLQESIDKLVNKRIIPYVRKDLQKVLLNRQIGAEIHIETDANCILYRFKEQIATICSGTDVDNIVFLKPGKHKLTFVSSEYPDVKIKQVLNIEPNIYSDFLDISFKEMISEKRKEVELLLLKKKEQSKEIFQRANEQYILHNYETALSLYRQAAEIGHPEAQNQLGWMLDYAKGTAENDQEAVKWYIKAAEQGCPDAQFNTGVMFMNGWGVEQDDFIAVKWYRQAAIQGDVDAQYNLGVMYNIGRGVAQDNTEAVKWYRKAASQGDADAQNKLAWMYDNGWGIASNKKEAMEWYEKAAKQGHASAQYNLGLLRKFGHGVTQNNIEAAKWFRKASKIGNPSEV